MQFIIKVTSACNLSCTYCSEGLRQLENLNIGIYKSFVDGIPKLLRHVGHKNVDIIWHGGEPLLIGKQWITEAIEYTNEVLSDFEISYSIQTNATLIDEEWIQIFKEFDFSIGISLDGYKELHDQYRIAKNGQGTYETIITNIKSLKSQGIPASLLMVLNSTVIDLDKLWNSLEDLNLNLKIQPVVPIGNAENQLVETNNIYNNYSTVLKYIFKKLLTSHMDITVQPISNLLTTILTNNSIGECSYNGTCTRNIITLYPNGDVGFCGRMTNENKSYIYGNILNHDIISLYDSEVSEKIRNRQIYLQENDCKECAFWEFCHGGCTVDALSSNGDINSKYHYCEGYKELLYYFMTEGLTELKKALVNRKMRYRLLIEEKDKLIKELHDER